MANEYARLMHHLSTLRQQLGNMVWHGTVSEVKKDKLRMKMGQDRNGEDQFGPWLDTGNHRGGSRERREYKKDQNITMFSPTGDPRQAMLFPHAPNKDFGPPDHSNNSGQGEEVYQMGDLRVRKKKDDYEIWLEPASKKNGNQDAGNTSNDNGEGGNGINEKIYLKKGQITGRVGKNWFVAHKKGAKLQAGNQFAVVTPEKLIVSKPWEVGKDPIQQDDKGTPGQGQDSGGASSSGTGSGSAT